MRAQVGLVMTAQALAATRASSGRTRAAILGSCPALGRRCGPMLQICSPDLGRAGFWWRAGDWSFQDG